MEKKQLLLLQGKVVYYYILNIPSACKSITRVYRKKLKAKICISKYSPCICTQQYLDKNCRVRRPRHLETTYI